MSNTLPKILLIESNRTIAKDIIAWLKNTAEVIHVNTLEELKIDSGVHDWDLFITDIDAQAMDDLNVTVLLREINPQASILVITENIKIDFIISAMQHHANDLVFKPLDKNEFIPRVELLLKASRTNKLTKNKKIILAIGAHPDDVEFGCSGTLAKYKSEGSEINILTLSLGGVGGDVLVRKKEAQAAAKALDANLFLGNFVDTEIISSAQTIQFIEKIVAQVNPTHIYTHSYSDNHQDHRNIHQATLVASRQTPNLHCYLSPSCTVDFRPNIFINIDDFIKKKLEVIKLFQSQHKSKAPYLHPEMILATARYWGRFCNYHLAEPMEVIKEQHT